MTYPAFIFWIFFIGAIWADHRTLLVLLFSSIAFGSLAVLPPEITGGASFLPKTMFAALLGARLVFIPLLVNPRGLLELARPTNLGFLLAFLAIGLITTIFMPRFFSGQIDIVPLRVVRFAAGEPLAPSPTNITQSVYLIVSVTVTFAVAMMARAPDFPKSFLNAVLIGGAVLFGTGLADMATSAVGQSDLLEPFRNAAYAMITGAEIAGVRRVIGLTSEASAFGSTCVSMASALILLRPVYADGAPRLAATVIAASLVAMALLSTSSSAYAGLVFFGLASALNMARRMASKSPISQAGLGVELTAAFISIIIILAAFLIMPEIFDPLLRVVDEVIFNKASSDSYFERSFWNEVGWNAFWSTYGLGVGLGSTRASNFFVAVLSNAGIFGSGCFLIFLFQVFFRQTSGSPRSNEMVSALKLAIIPSLGMAALGSATPDFEPWLGSIFGAIIGMTLRPEYSLSAQIPPSPSRDAYDVGLRSVP